MAALRRTARRHVYLIQPKFPPSYWGQEFFIKMTHYGAVYPPLGLITLAALTPSEYAVTVCDESAGELVDFETDAEIVGITGYLFQMVRVFELADPFRGRGKTVVIGGPMATLLPEQCRAHCDVLFEGEAEYTWPRFLRSNFRPLSMTEAELKQGLEWLFQRLYAPEAFAARLMGNLSRFRNVRFRSEPVRASYAAVFLRLAWYYGGKGRAARKFFWGCLWKTLRQAPRIVGQMVIYLGMYVHFCKVHQLALSWEPWGAPVGRIRAPSVKDKMAGRSALVAGPGHSKRLVHLFCGNREKFGTSGDVP